ncbi:hypothetical protein BD410DRAFT_517831 [Rickenella mellea]|uniref:Uncharacterized protein n=1 Tax=Rickenella mellea TaxID=50990 RepID=A0A4Y7QGX1_9AGAM|nr:hypothetical protein BD410DRAFT_517831 [Rickenella mellea]
MCCTVLVGRSCAKILRMQPCLHRACSFVFQISFSFVSQAIRFPVIVHAERRFGGLSGFNDLVLEYRSHRLVNSKVWALVHANGILYSSNFNVSCYLSVLHSRRFCCTFPFACRIPFP